jgi:hypothetical protein
MVDGRTYTYLIVDGNNWELGKGVYTASGTTLSRVTVLQSRISGTLGTTKVTLSGTAQVRIVDASEDKGGVRGTRPVTTTSDTIANTDFNRPITYNNASAIAVSLAQAGASSQFLDGWSTWLQNIGAGTVTITPATSTINGASTLVLAQNLGAFIWSDGTNYHAYFVPVTKPLLASAATATGLSLLGAADASAARAAAGVPGANLLINPDFRINQRGYASGGTIGGAYAYGMHDRWKSGASGGIYTFTQLASSTQITITAGSIVQVIEDIQPTFQQSTATIVFLRGSVTWRQVQLSGLIRLRVLDSFSRTAAVRTCSSIFPLWRRLGSATSTRAPR